MRLNKELKTVMVSTFFWGLLAHAMMFLEFYPSHDSLSIVSEDAIWEITLGRFCQPLYLLLRGNINSPWLVGLLSLIYLSFSLFLIIRLFDIKSTAIIFVLSGFFVTNLPLIVLYATYINWADIYMLALLCCCAGVYLVEKYQRGFIPAVLLLSVSMGLYQSYISVAIGLMIILVFINAIIEKSVLKILKKGVRFIACLICSAIFYIIFVKISLWVAQVDLTDGYNGMLQLMRSDLHTLINLIPGVYKHFFDYYFGRTGYNTQIVQICFSLLIIIALYLWIKYMLNRQVIMSQIVISVFMVVILPLGIDFIYIVSTGWAHLLMLYSFTLIYLLFLVPIDKMKQIDTLRNNSGLKILYGICIGLSAVLIWHNITYSNGAYYYKNIIGRTNDAYMVSMLIELENNDEYVIGQTPVAIIGNFEESFMAGDRRGFEEYRGILGMHNTSVTYLGSLGYYCTYVVGKPINLIYDEGWIDEISRKQEVQNLPTFPHKGYCCIVDGVMVIKMS